MVPKKSKITSAKQLKGATVCVQSGTTTEKNLSDYSKANDLSMKPVVFETQEATNKAYFAGRCQAYTTDASGLASVRNKEAGKPDDHVILPELISKEPLGPVGAPRRRRVLHDRQVGRLRADRGRGVRHHAGQRRPDEGRQHRPGGAAHPRHVGGHRQAARPRQGLGLPRHQGGRQLRRDLRAQRRPEVGAEAAARRQQPVEQGRPACTRRRCAERDPTTEARAGTGPGGPAAASRGAVAPAPAPSPNCAPRPRMAAASKHFRWSWRSAAFRGLRLPGRRACCSSSRPAGTWSTTRCTTCGCAGSRAASTSCRSRPASRSARACSRSTRRETLRQGLPVGLSNTLRVAIVGIVLATLLGTLVGIGRLSRNFLVRTLCSAYVESFRNVPLLLQLFIWYFVLTEFAAADRRGAAAAAGRLLQQERPAVSDSRMGARAMWLAVGAAGSGASGAWAGRGWARRRRDATGQRAAGRCCRCC